jgi:Ala-tRNA(Pro) deacylase
MSEKETERIIELFKQHNIEHEIIEHGITITSADSARERGSLLKQGVKSLLVKTRKEPVSYVVANLPADKKMDYKKLEHATGLKKLTLANPEEILAQTGCEIGAVPPFGYKNQFQIIVDPTVFDNEVNEFNIGQRTVSAKLKTSELKKLFQLLDVKKTAISKE